MPDTKNTTKGAGIVLAPEVARTSDGSLAVRVVLDTEIDCTPIEQRRYARYVEFASDSFMRKESGPDAFRIALHPVVTKREYTETTYNNAPVEVWTITRGRCQLYIDAGRGGLEEWETSLDHVEELGRALLAAVAEARARRLFE